MKFKPLAWETSPFGFAEAHTFFGRYLITEDFKWWWEHDRSLVRRSGSVDEAKAAAQNDFEQRTLGAFE